MWNDISSSPATADIQCVLDSYPRLAGYHLLRVVELADGDDIQISDSFLDSLFESFDDKPWIPVHERPAVASWLDSEVAASIARERVVRALMGGPEIGHLEKTMPRDIADAL